MAYDEDTLIGEIQERQEAKAELRQQLLDYQEKETKRKRVGVPSREAAGEVEVTFANGETRTLKSHRMREGARRQFPVPGKTNQIYDIAFQPRGYDYYQLRMCIDVVEAREENTYKVLKRYWVDLSKNQTDGFGNVLLAIAEGRVEEEEVE